MTIPIGKKIRLLRQKREWSLDTFADKLSVSVPAISKIETGITDVNLSRLGQICELFGISLIELFSTDDEVISVQAQDLADKKQRLRERETEIIILQRKVIDLYDLLKTYGPDLLQGKYEDDLY